MTSDGRGSGKCATPTHRATAWRIYADREYARKTSRRGSIVVMKPGTSSSNRKPCAAMVGLRTVGLATAYVVVTSCMTPGELRLSPASAQQLATTEIQGYRVAQVRSLPSRPGLRDGVVVVLESTSQPDRLGTSVAVNRFESEALHGAFDDAFQGFARSMRAKVVRVDTHGAGALTFHFGQITEPWPGMKGLPCLLWFRSHQDVAVMLVASDASEAISLATAYVAAWPPRD